MHHRYKGPLHHRQRGGSHRPPPGPQPQDIRPPTLPMVLCLTTVTGHIPLHLHRQCEMHTVDRGSGQLSLCKHQRDVAVGNDDRLGWLGGCCSGKQPADCGHPPWGDGQQWLTAGWCPGASLTAEKIEQRLKSRLSTLISCLRLQGEGHGTPWLHPWQHRSQCKLCNCCRVVDGADVQQR